MLSVNQINAQVTLTEMWKSSKHNNYPIKMDKLNASVGARSTRAITRGDLVPKGSTIKSQSTFINDASKGWQRCLNVSTCNFQSA